MNEPAVFDGPGKTMPLDNIHRIEEPGFATRTATHAEIHNIVGLENARATYEGLLKLRPDERPFVLTRATFAGGQRYGFTWTGDNSATWNHLRLATQQLLNLGISGISFVGDDIGGFNGSPPPDLLTRWIEIGAFNPLYPRPHHQRLADAGSLGPWSGAGSDSPPLHRNPLPPAALHLHPGGRIVAHRASHDASHFSRVSRKSSRRLRTDSAISTPSFCWAQPAGRSASRSPRPSTTTWSRFRKASGTTSGLVSRLPLPLPEPTIVDIANAGPGAVLSPARQNSSRARYLAGLCSRRKHSAAAAANPEHG